MINLLGQLIELMGEELNLNIKSMTATTLKLSSLQLNLELYKCYYIQNHPTGQGKIIDLDVDSPPDLVLEVDINNPEINKKQFYQSIKVPELWHYNGETLNFYLLNKGEYQESQNSANFPLLNKSMLYAFLGKCKIQGETFTKLDFSVWLREQIMRQRD